MISTEAFLDELEKIAQVDGEESVPGPLVYMPPSAVPAEDRFITSPRMKRALIAAGLAGVGAAVGHGAAGAVRHMTSKLSPEKVDLISRYAPAAAGALTLPLGWLAREQARRTDNYIAYGKSNPDG